MPRAITILAIVLAIASALTATSLMAQTSGGVVSGRVTDDGGRPVAGATVIATYQSFGGGGLLYGGRYNRQARTGPDGRYAIALGGLPVGAYAVAGSHEGMSLIPETDATFASNAQTVRDFRHGVVERTAADDYGNGGVFVAENDIGDYSDLEGLEVTLVPLGGGKTITRTVQRTGEGLSVTGLPFGAYRATARLNGRPVTLKLWGPDVFDRPFAASVDGRVRSGVASRILRVYVRP
jgi:hypothetical protein